MRIEPSRMFAARSHARRRNAMTLLEVMASISVLLIIGLSAASILGKVTDVGVRGNSSQQCRQSVGRLASVLRQDIRRADDVNVNLDDALIELLSESQVIRYAWNHESGDLIRQSKQGDSPPSFDRFKLPAHCQPAVRANDEIVTLNLHRESQLHPWIIEAKRP